MADTVDWSERRNSFDIGLSCRLKRVTHILKEFFTRSVSSLFLALSTQATSMRRAGALAFPPSLYSWSASPATQ